MERIEAFSKAKFVARRSDTELVTTREWARISYSTTRAPRAATEMRASRLAAYDERHRQCPGSQWQRDSWIHHDVCRDDRAATSHDHTPQEVKIYETACRPCCCKASRGERIQPAWEMKPKKEFLDGEERLLVDKGQQNAQIDTTESGCVPAETYANQILHRNTETGTCCNRGRRWR